MSEKDIVAMSRQVDTLVDALRATEVQRDELLAALEAVEWVGVPDRLQLGYSDDICPWCGGWPLDDEEKAAGLTEHKDDCKRQAAIARAKRPE